MGEWTGQMAEHLADIHHFDGAGAELSFLPLIAMRYARLLAERPDTLDTTIEEGRIRAMLRAAWPFPQHNATTLLHGDFWPGNLLWHNGRVAAILDWEDAAIGDPLADLANTRLEILWAHGQDAMQHFTSHYQARMALDVRALPLWDLCAALRPAGKIDAWAADQAAAQMMRDRHAWFRTQAFVLLDSHDNR
jgi:aminoglycoside phosphotransferase (APT) family kinase protein